MTDYSNANKNKAAEAETTSRPQKQVEKVVVGEVVIRKKGIGRKFKDLVVSADLKGIAIYLVLNRVVPSVKNMIYDTWVEGGNRILFPNSTPNRPIIDPRGMLQRTVFNYQSPISRSSSIPLGQPRNAPAREIGPRASSHPAVQNVRPGEQYVFASKEDAIRVLDTLREALDKYEEPISLGDLYEAMGLPSSHVDQKWGWTTLAEVKVLQSREGYLLDFPPSEPIV